MRLKVLGPAELEAAQAAVWYDDQRQGLGDDFITELRRAIDRIESDRESFATAEFYTGKREIRRCLLQRFPYVVVFESRPTETLIVAVGHARRRPLYWIERLASE